MLEVIGKYLKKRLVVAMGRIKGQMYVKDLI